VYEPKSIERDGFIHCSGVDQVINVANFLYAKKTDLVLLCIDTHKVVPEVVYEDSYNEGKNPLNFTVGGDSCGEKRGKGDPVGLRGH
jgi:uncharacterized protein (DUF952 family)